MNLRSRLKRQCLKEITQHKQDRKRKRREKFRCEFVTKGKLWGARQVKLMRHHSSFSVHHPPTHTHARWQDERDTKAISGLTNNLYFLVLFFGEFFPLQQISKIKKTKLIAIKLGFFITYTNNACFKEKEIVYLCAIKDVCYETSPSSSAPPPPPRTTNDSIKPPLI